VDSNAAEVTASHRLQQLAARAEHDHALGAGVSDDERVNGRARDAGGTAELAASHELALHAEHTRLLPLSATAT
jgi:hypothetical protein